MEKKRRTIRLDDETWKSLEELAEKRGTSVSKIITRVVDAELTIHRWVEFKRERSIPRFPTSDEN